MRKYGIENFAITVVRRCLLSELNYWEEYYVDKFCTLRPGGYNLTDGGDGVRGLEFSAQSRKKMSDAAAARPTEQRKAQGEFVREWWTVPKNKRMMKKSLTVAGAKRRGRKRSPEIVEQVATANRGLKRSEATRARCRAAANRRWENPAQREATSKKLKLYFTDPANCEKNRQAQLNGANCSAEHRAAASEKTIAHFANPANRKKHSQNQIAYNISTLKPADRRLDV